MKWNQKGIVICLILFVLVFAMMIGSAVRNNDKSGDTTYASEEDMISLENMMSPAAESVTGEAVGENHQTEAPQNSKKKKKESTRESAASASPTHSPKVDGQKGKGQSSAHKKKATKPPAKTQLPQSSQQPTVKPTAKPTEQAVVYLEIQCKRILDQQSLWKEGIEEIIPKSGVFYSGSCSFSQGETVYDILKHICREQDIELDSSYTPLYGSYYVRGIGNLYEFDCGSESGWKYSVNGEMPGVGSSQYTVASQDRIVFFYDYEY